MESEIFFRISPDQICWLQKKGWPLTLENYLALAYRGDIKSLSQRERELPAEEVRELIEQGVLHTDVKSNYRN